jgi:pilus assembly protein CpaB
MGRGGHRRTGPRTLAPLFRERIAITLRGGGWSRPIVLRRIVAGLLVLLAAALALQPKPGTVTVLVAAHDLAPGSVLVEGDVTTRELPEGIVPSGTMTDAAALVGRVLASAARAGEPITDVRLTGPELVALQAPDGDAATVPVRLSDPDVAELLHPGAKVDVVSIGERDAEPTVLAERATVVTVLDEPGSTIGQAGRPQRGRLVVVVLPRHAATRVAAASLSQPLAITLRQGRR